MKVESTAGQDEYKVWLSPDEYEATEQTLQRLANNEDHPFQKSWVKRYVVLLLGGRIGLRANEIAAMCFSDVWKQDDLHRLTVREPVGKDTTGSGGKRRDAQIPRDVYVELLEAKYELDRDDDEPLVGVRTRRVRQMVHEIGEQMANVARDNAKNVPGRPDDWMRISSHDLRRYYAQDCLVRREMNPHVVMDLGGWSSLGAMENYLNSPSPDIIADEIREAGLD